MPYYEPGLYDVAILHVDQQSTTKNHPKRVVYEDFDSAITDIPKIVINHGTPVYPEAVRVPGTHAEKIQNDCIRDIKRLIGDYPMIVNSFEASSANEWGFGIPIIHGMDPSEWYDLPKEPRVFTALSPIGLDTYYNRSCMRNVEKILVEKYGYTLWQAKKNTQTHLSWDAYRNYLGKSLVYLDVSYRTPMNRARTEAFFSGCCVVQVEGAHDLGRWAVNEENIILVPNDAHAIAEKIVALIEGNNDYALAVGKNGKKMAMQMFSRKRYREQWLSVLNNVVAHAF